MRNKPDEFMDKIESGIKAAKQEFCIQNELKRKDILVENRDAFLILKPVFNLQLNEFIKFRKDNEYSSFFNLSGIEFYYSSWKRSLVVKKLNKETLKFHKNFFINFIKQIIVNSENIYDERNVFYLKRKRSEYLELKLDPECYKEMNNICKYRLKINLLDKGCYVDNFEDFNSVDITFNYKRFILPLFGILLK